MASILGNALFGRGGGGGKKKEQHRRREALMQGPAGLRDRMMPNRWTRPDLWKDEMQKRKEDIMDQYWSNKEVLQNQRRHQEKEIERELARERDHIRKHYRLHELGEQDPRRKVAERKALKKFESIERKYVRDHKRNWRKQLHELQQQRDAQKYHVGEQMRKERRMLLGQDKKGGAMPWEL